MDTTEPTPTFPPETIAPADAPPLREAMPSAASVASVHPTPVASVAPGPAVPGPSRARTAGVVLAASLVSATLASVLTAGTILVTQPQGSSGPTGAPAAEPASQQTSVTTDSTLSIVNVAARVNPAVVTITTSSVGGFGPFAMPSTGVGSGFVYRSDGMILTNWHVVDGATDVTVAFNDGTKLTGRVVDSDPTDDLAIVKVDATGLPTAEIGSSADLQTGQTVVAIGSPLGTFTDSVTSGILSALGRSIDVGGASGREHLSNLLQTDAAINEGNSGGPLLDLSGKVIGINVAVSTTAQGIGFAIPIDAAQPLIDRASA
jgi:serine protease Do